jgi:hypothetical protein
MCVDPDNFKDPIPSEMICSICFHVFCYPNSVMVKLFHILQLFHDSFKFLSLKFKDDDGHEFCAPCIEKWLKKNKRCPLDNTYLDETMLRPLGLMARGLLAK